MFSTRQNIDRLSRGDTNFESQYPEATGPEMSLEEIGSAVGHPEWLEIVVEKEVVDSAGKVRNQKTGSLVKKPKGRRSVNNLLMKLCHHNNPHHDRLCR
jgi:hypothetical protein